MLQSSSTFVIAMVALLAITITTNTAQSAPVTPAPTGVQDGAFVLVSHNATNHAAPTINQLKARQEVRIRLNEQLQVIKKMQAEQSQLLEQQLRQTDQHLIRQNARTRNHQLSARQHETLEVQRRTTLKDDQINAQGLSSKRLEQTASSRNIKRNLQEQDIKEKYPALLNYYKSLTRRILRTQQDRLAAPDTTSLP